MLRRTLPRAALSLRRAPYWCTLARFYDRFRPLQMPLERSNLTLALRITAPYRCASAFSVRRGLLVVVLPPLAPRIQTA